MKYRNIIKFLKIIPVFVLLVGMQIAIANETFQNNLLNLDVSQNPVGGIKVTLYTNKPYDDNVVINKKNDLEYVILMPETSNSLTSKPSLSKVSATVKNIEVKTQPYKVQEGQKGYTKIVISTLKPVEITPKLQTVNVSNYQLSEKDYSELLAQSTKKTTPVTKSQVQKSVVVAGKKASVSEKSVKITKPEAKNKTVTVTSKQVKSVQKTTLKTQPQKAQKLKTVEKNIQKKPAQKIQPAIKKETASEVIKKNGLQEIKQQEEVKPVVEQKAQEIKAPIQEPSVNEQTQQQASQVLVQDQPKQEIVPRHVGRLQRYKTKLKHIIKNNFNTILGLASASFLLFLLILVRISKSLKKQKQQKMAFEAGLKEKTTPATDYSEKISEDMGWREKFQTYVETKTQSEQEEKPQEIKQSNAKENIELDELFGVEQEIAERYPEVQEQVEQEPIKSQSQEDNFIISDESSFEQIETIQDNTATSYDDMSEFESLIDENSELNEDVSLDELFDSDEYDYQEEILNGQEEISYPEQPLFYQQPTMVEAPIFQEETNKDSDIILSEFAIDNNKRFYLVNYEDSTALVGQIGDEIFVLKKFDEKVQGKLQARINETKGSSTNYMTRVGNFKALVEVTPQDMNLLIEL